MPMYVKSPLRQCSLEILRMIVLPERQPPRCPKAVCNMNALAENRNMADTSKSANAMNNR